VSSFLFQLDRKLWYAVVVQIAGTKTLYTIGNGLFDLYVDGCATPSSPTAKQHHCDRRCTSEAATFRQTGFDE
jgi:hypothetical protein